MSMAFLPCYLQTLYKLCTNEIMLQVDENLCSRLPLSFLKAAHSKQTDSVPLIRVSKLKIYILKLNWVENHYIEHQTNSNMFNH